MSVGPTTPITDRKDGTLRGLANGIVEPSSTLIPCVVFGPRYPNWLPVLQQLGYRPVLVFLRDSTYLAEVEATVPDGCAVFCGSDWRVYGASLPPLHGSHVAFVDGKPTPDILNLCGSMLLSVVFGIGAPRKLPNEWKLRRHGVSHHLIGGVTTSKHHIVGCFRNTTTPEHLQCPLSRPFVARDLSSVLEATAPLPQHRGKEVLFTRAPEVHEHLEEFEVRNVGSGTTPVYHGGGWLPPKPTPFIRIKTKSVFVSGDRWIVRRLQAKEFLYAHDWGDYYVEKLMPRVFERSFPPLVPGKSLVEGMIHVCHALSEAVSSVEGGAAPPFSSPEVLVTALSSSQPEKPVRTPKRKSMVDELEEAPCKVLRSGTEETKNSGSANKEVGRMNMEPAESNLLEEISRDKRERKATKSDDAEAPIYLWTEHYIEGSSIDWNAAENQSKRLQIEQAMEVLRSQLFLWKWKRRLLKEFSTWVAVPGSESGIKWLSAKYEPGKRTPSASFYRYRWSKDGRRQYQEWYAKRNRAKPNDMEAGMDAVQRACRSTWWEWSDGSRPFHWRWPEWYQSTIRDGLEVHLDGLAPAYKHAQADESNMEVKAKVKEKLNKVRARRYIGKGYVVSLTSFFSVPKGETDIRMVYDGTKSGLNQAMWVPRFGLPTVDTHLRSIEEGTFLADVDVGECFLNFPLHKKLQALAGVDLTCYFPNPNHSPVWECWKRALMGVKSSPYQAVQGMSVAEEVIRGNPKDDGNVFRWKRVRMNCPGSADYDPSKPWVSKLREDGTIAADLVGYVDDLRPSGPGRAEAWQAARRTASMLNYLGIQDAARKRRDSSRKPGAWAGAVVVTQDDGVFVTSDEEKWKKAKGMVVEILDMIARDPMKLDRKRLESIRGFLIYVVRTYPPLKPYVMGLHLTIDGWRPTRDDGGWRLSTKDVEEKFQNESHDHAVGNLVGPKEVEAKPRLLADMEALKVLMAPDKPLLRRVRSRRGRKVAYTFGDASEAGFGRTIAVDGKVYYQYGQWDHRAHQKSSNWREAQNLLDGLEMAAKEHSLTGLELFIFTDNYAAERAFWKGTSHSKLLAQIALEMRKLEMKYDLIIHVIHVSGRRMIKQGTDGLSRADQSTGVMAGSSMEEFIPLNLSALERSPELEACLRKYLGELDFQFLKPEGWFDEYHDFGNYIWAPPPAAAEVVVDLISKARHKRPESMHLVLVPRLMTGRWRRLMARSSDHWFEIDWSNCWDLSEHYEPLLCFVFSPYAVSNPRLNERKQLYSNMERLLSRENLSAKSDGEKWNILFKLLFAARKICPMPNGFLPGVLHSSRKEAVPSTRIGGRKRRGDRRKRGQSISKRQRR